MSENTRFKLAVASTGATIALALYLVIVWLIAITNLSQVTCPKDQHMVINPWSVGTTGKCEL